jgi:hypothetical protein
MQEKVIPGLFSRYLSRLEAHLRLRGFSDPDLLEEMENHLLEAREHALASGLDPDTAEQQALMRFGTPGCVAHSFGWERKLMKQRIFLVLALVFGLLVAYVDTRPHWDDTGITVFVFLAGAAVIGLLIEKRPWLAALAMGVWLPSWYIFTTHDWTMLVLLAFPFLGTYVGWFLKLGLRRLRQTG